MHYKLRERVNCFTRAAGLEAVLRYLREVSPSKSETGTDPVGVEKCTHGPARGANVKQSKIAKPYNLYYTLHMKKIIIALALLLIIVVSIASLVLYYFFSIKAPS